MKKITFLVTALLVTGAFYSQNVSACSMAPVDIPTQIIDLQRFVSVGLEIDKANITSVNVTGASGNYIWSDPMCPEGIAAEATFSVDFENPVDPFTKGCTGEVKVSKTAPTGLSNIHVKREYKVDILQSGSCLE